MERKDRRAKRVQLGIMVKMVTPETKDHPVLLEKRVKEVDQDKEENKDFLVYLVKQEHLESPENLVILDLKGLLDRQEILDHQVKEVHQVKEGMLDLEDYLEKEVHKVHLEKLVYLALLV